MACTRPGPRLAFLSFCLLAAGLSAQNAPPPNKEQFHLFLLIGQSNMAGRGTVAAADKSPVPRVLMLSQTDEWVPAVEPMHFDKPAVIGVGPGRSFGVAIASATPGVTIGLIPCAVGGSPIDAWKPGAFYAETKTHPWDDAMRRAKLALQAGTLKGILWHQGESDSKPELAASYAPKLLDLVTRLRRELDAPAVPFIAGQMGRFASAPWNENQILVDRAQQQLPQKAPLTAYVSAEGLTDKGDKIHFDTESFRELGRRYAEAYLKLAAKK